jgi:flavin-dependent dehydrogenase
MNKLVRFILVAVVFFLPFTQGCQKLSEDSVGKISSVPAVCERVVNESARNIPVSFDVDVVVVGGTSGGVAAAVAAAQNGAKVFLAAERPYLGEDISGTYRLWLEQGEEPKTELTKKIFSRSPVTPMQVKRALDEALLEANVQFLYGCYVSDILFGNKGEITGVVIANRSGRQAVRAKVIIDATARANIARMTGAEFAPYPVGPQILKRIVVGGEVQTGSDIVEVRKLPTTLSVKGGLECEVFEYTLKIPVKDGSFASFAQAEQVARDLTWNPGQKDASEMLFCVPPDHIKGKKSLSGRWPGAEVVDPPDVRRVNLDIFRPTGIEHLFVLGGCADISREAAEKLLHPLEIMEAGSRIGAAAAMEAKRIRRPRNVKLAGKPGTAVISGDIKENLSGIRVAQNRVVVTAGERAVPVLGEYDVVVVGGGTGGAPAGIAAARQGAKTLVVEYLYGLGGVGTMGLISKYYYGYINGFTREVDEGVASFATGAGVKGDGWNIQSKMEWYRRELRKAGADVWFGAIGCGAFVENGRVKGVVVATPQGRGVVLAKVVIDSTGNADIAAAAGAECDYTNGTGVAVQGAGLPPRQLGAGYTNTDWTFIDDSDVVDTWRAFVVAKSKFKGAYDLGQLIDTRERRRVVGDFVMSPLDILNYRKYPDTIAMAKSNFDSHGFTIHPIFLLRPPDRKEMLVSVPYRCLLPKGLEGILVTGLGASSHRDAMPVIRMQADIQNQGYAAGVAAAMAAKSGRGLRDIDIKVLQKHLVEKGNLPESVLTDKDSFPLPKEKIAEAVGRVVNNYEGLEVVLAGQEDAMPLLRSSYKAATDKSVKLIYAHILGMLGDETGVDTMLEAVKSNQWDKGWNFTGMGQYGMSISPLDSLIIALGCCGDKRAVGVIVEKVEQLDEKSEFSHCRAVAMAIGEIGDKTAAKSLSELLKKPGIMGHAFTDIEEAIRRTPPDGSDTKTRNASLRELFLAAALYRCGDYKGLGEKILKEYSQDLRAHYARHASIVLEEKPGRRKIHR